MTIDLFSQITQGGDLDATPSYPFRSWHWVASESLLTIRVQKGKGVNTRSELDVYQVEVQPPVPGFIGLRFLLSNVSDPEAAEVYEVYVGWREGEGSCSCKAGIFKAPSDKHREALFAAMRAGAFDAFKTEQVEPPAPRGPWRPGVVSVVKPVT